METTILGFGGGALLALPILLVVALRRRLRPARARHPGSARPARSR
jgi:hypothetical protein